MTHAQNPWRETLEQLYPEGFALVYLDGDRRLRTCLSAPKSVDQPTCAMRMTCDAVRAVTDLLEQTVDVRVRQLEYGIRDKQDGDEHADGDRV